MRSRVLATMLALSASSAWAFQPVSCSGGDGEEWLIDGHYIATETPATTRIGVLTNEKELPEGKRWSAIFPGVSATLTMSGARYTLVWVDGVVSEGSCKTLTYTTPKLFRRQTDQLFPRPFKPVVCTVTTATWDTRRYRIDGRYMIALDGRKARHQLSRHRTVGRTDEWASMRDGEQLGGLTIENRRAMMWNPAGTVKVLGTCRDARRVLR